MVNSNGGSLRARKNEITPRRLPADASQFKAAEPGRSFDA
jgi:hypothetical protein